MSNASLAAPVHSAVQVAEMLDLHYLANEFASFGPPPQPLEGFITFFDPGLSIDELRDSVAPKGKIFYPQGWYNIEHFARSARLPRYRQVRLKPLPNSFAKTFHEQQACVPAGEEIPSARVVVTALVVHFLATGQRLLDSCYVRTADVELDGRRVCVGRFGRGGLYVNDRWDDGRDSDIGLASSRNF